VTGRRAKRRPWLTRSAIPVNRDDFPPFAERVIPFPPNWVLVYALVNSSLFALHLRFLPAAIAYATLVAPFVVFFVYVIANSIRATRLGRRARRSGLLLCTACAYDMRNSIGQWKCPECGHPWEHEDAMRRWGVFIDGRLRATAHDDLNRRRHLLEHRAHENRRQQAPAKKRGRAEKRRP
jgi:hypothetical protein